MEENLTAKETVYKDANKDIEVYSDFLLKIYDYFVLSFCCPLIWRCSKEKILTLYNKNISNNHLDIGVGTGYFLDKCHFTAKPKITLLDLSENCLKVTTKRIARYQPQSIQADIFQDLPFGEMQFDSIGLNYLIHCLPGTIRDKSKIFENINPSLSPNGKIFGATVLGKDVKLGFVANKLMKTYNKHQIFCNLEDDLTGLKEVLSEHYSKVEVKMSGAVALFSAQK
jgi:ubiquinone/menaquinone biosynthesis C-methylase UbiE